MHASLSHTHYWHEVGMLKVQYRLYTIIIVPSNHTKIGAIVDRMRIVHPTIDLNSPLLEPDTEHKILNN